MLKRLRPSLFIKKNTNFAAKCLTCLDKAFSTENINDNIRHTMRKYLFIFAMLLCWGHTTTAQTTDNLLNIAGLEPDITGQTTYYLKNVGTGLHMSYGAEWGTQCIETQAAHPIIVEDNGDGTFAIASFGGYLNSDNLYMDQAKENSKWKLVKVAGYTNQYFLYGSGDHTLTSVGNSAGILTLKTPEGKASQRWIFTNGQDIKDTKMPYATAECPFDVTVAIKGAAFDYVDSWEPTANTPDILREVNPYNQKWENYNANAKWFADCGVRDTPESYNYCGIINGFADALSVTYKMTLPKGTYHFSFEAFYKYMKVVSVQNQTRPFLGSWSDDGAPTVTTTDNGTMNATVTFNGEGFTLARNTSLEYDNGISAAAAFRDNDDYKHHGTFYLSKETEVSIVISKPATTANGESTSGGGTFSTSRTVTTTSYPSQIYIDDFTLLYFGTEEIANANISHNAMFAGYLNANIAEYKSTLNAEGQAAFDQAFNININEIENRTDYYQALEILENAYNAGIIAHSKSAGGDLTALITNNSFEKGDLTGWTVAWNSVDTGVRDNNNPYTTIGTDGRYLFNSWWNGVPITQTITDLPNGIYKLTVAIASGDTGNDATVYLTANEQKLGVNPPSGGGTFSDYSLKFIVTDGTATIGVVGGNDDDTPENPIGSYTPDGHWWYKCDNFRLEYITEDYLELSESATSIGQHNEIWGKVTIKRTIKPNTWSTFVVPFDIPAALLTEWDVKELSGSIHNEENENISLTFVDAEDGIKAGVPYMVRNTTMAENLTALSMENVVVNTQLRNASTDHVEFIGTYTNGYVPEGAFFISSNTFYRSAAENSNTMKGYRAYIKVKEGIANARSLTYRTDDETGITEESTGEVTVVAIYNMQGVRLDDMQEGINILQMSNGSTIKVVIK